MIKNIFSRKNAFLTLFIGIFILSGCGQNDKGKSESSTPIPEVVNHPVNEEAGTEFSDAKFTEAENRAEDIPYYSEDGIDLLRALHRCVSDGTNVYLVHGEPDLYIMPIGTDEHSPANINNPEKMTLCNIALDANGKIHLLVAGQDNETWFIWQLDENYQVDKSMDISAYFEEKHMPLWFLIDKDGTYYLQWAIDRNGIIVDSHGILQHKFTPKSLGIRWIYEAAIGKDGQFYILYSNSDDNFEIGKLDTKKCLLENEGPTLCFSGNETFNAMSCGTDTNLLLFSPYSGVWAYDNENEIIENRVPLSELGFESNAELYPLTFLPDGRLILLEKTANGKNDNQINNIVDENSKNWLIKYIPAGK